MECIYSLFRTRDILKKQYIRLHHSGVYPFPWALKIKSELRILLRAALRYVGNRTEQVQCTPNHLQGNRRAACGDSGVRLAYFRAVAAEVSVLLFL